MSGKVSELDTGDCKPSNFTEIFINVSLDI